MILSNRDNVRCVEMKMPPVQFSQPSPPLLKVFLFLLLLLKQTPGKMMTLIYFRKNAKAPASSQRPVFNYENLLDQSFSTTPLSLFFFFNPIFLWRWNEQALYWEPGNLLSKPNYNLLRDLPQVT